MYYNIYTEICHPVCVPFLIFLYPVTIRFIYIDRKITDVCEGKLYKVAKIFRKRGAIRKFAEIFIPEKF